jgi:hypothetical protein
MKRGLLHVLTLLAVLAGGAAPAAAESPQHFALELKFGPYVPALDETEGLNGKTPFSDRFGDPADPYQAAPSRGLLSLVEFDYQFFHRFGVLGIGLGGGYYRKTARAFGNVAAPPAVGYCQVKPGVDGGPRTYALPNGMPTSADACFSEDENIFNVVPLSLLLVYRFDVLDKRFRIPIIPYVKLGLGYYIWWFGNSGSFVSQVNTQDAEGAIVSANASGATAGFLLHPGLAIDLSAIDAAAARVIDQEIGLNRVTAFIEMHGAFVKGCGCSNAMKLNLSDLSFTAGLGFEF